MNDDKFSETLQAVKLVGAERRANRNTPAKKNKAEQDELEAEVKKHIQTQIIAAIRDGKLTFKIMTPPIDKADNILNKVCQNNDLAFVELDPIPLETDYLAFGMCATLRVFEITVN